MDIHQNARTTPASRAELVARVLDDQLPVSLVAAAAGVCPRTVRKWVARYQAEGPAGLSDRSSRPARQPRATPVRIVARITALRLQRQPGIQIARAVGVSPATVSRILRRAGLHRLDALEPAPPVRRYEREHPGELLHLDIKKLPRFQQPGHRVTGNRRQCTPGAGWDYVHVCIDDHSRVGFAQIYPDETDATVTVFLRAAVAYVRDLGVHVTGVMTDNGGGYRSRVFQQCCARLGLRHLYTRPYTPRTNGKAERFIQTALREWAYARAYRTSRQRATRLTPWLHRYNWHRPHGSLNHQPPISRLGLSRDKPVEVPQLAVHFPETRDESTHLDTLQAVLTGRPSQQCRACVSSPHPIEVQTRLLPQLPFRP